MPSVLEQSDVEPTKHSYLLKKYVVPIVFQFAYDWLAHLVETWYRTETNQSYPKGMSINYVFSLWGEGVAPSKFEKNRTKPGNPYYLVLFQNRTKSGTVLSGDPLYNYIM